MAHNTTNNHDVYDQVQASMVLENPTQVCVWAPTNTTVYIEVWNTAHGTLAFRPNGGGAAVGAIAVQVTSTPSSLAYLASLNYESGNLPQTGPNPQLIGFPDGAVGGFILVDPNAANNVYYNVGGTSDGSTGAGNGIAVGYAGPNAQSPRQLPPGGTLKFGGFIE